MTSSLSTVFVFPEDGEVGVELCPERGVSGIVNGVARGVENAILSGLKSPPVLDSASAAIHGLIAPFFCVCEFVVCAVA